MAEAAYEEAVAELGPDACGLFHKGVPVDERGALLAAYDAGELKLLVCTGLGSRGLPRRELRLELRDVDALPAELAVHLLDHAVLVGQLADHAVELALR